MGHLIPEGMFRLLMHLFPKLESVREHVREFVFAIPLGTPIQKVNFEIIPKFIVRVHKAARCLQKSRPKLATARGSGTCEKPPLSVLRNAHDTFVSPRVKAVVEAICASYGVHPENLTEPGNRVRIRRARHAVVYVCRARCWMSWSDIRKTFGMKHNPVHAFKFVMRRLIDGDAETRQAVTAGKEAAARFPPEPRPRSGRRRPARA